MGDMVSAPTVASLAAHLQQAVALWSPLVRLRAEGSLPPLFLVHPAGGQVISYRSLLPFLDNQPVFAFEAAGLRDGQAPDESIQAMVDAYMEFEGAEKGLSAEEAEDEVVRFLQLSRRSSQRRTRT